MNSGISEADAGKHAGQVHAGPRLQVLGVPHSSGISPLSGTFLLRSPPQMHLPFHVVGHHPEGVAGPHVADGVAALVRGTVDGVGGAGAPLVIRKGGVRLQSVAEAERRDRFTAGGKYGSERRRRETDHSTSKPLLAATLSGMLSVCRGSTMPRVGLMALLAIPDSQSQPRLSLTSMPAHFHRSYLFWLSEAHSRRWPLRWSRCQFLRSSELKDQRQM